MGSMRILSTRKMELSVQAALFIFLAAASDQASAYQGAICGFKEYASLGVITYDRVFIAAEDSIASELEFTGVYTAAQTGNYMIIVYGSAYTKNSILEVVLKKQGITTPSGEVKIITQKGKKITTSGSGARFIGLNEGDKIHLEFSCTGQCELSRVNFCITYPYKQIY